MAFFVWIGAECLNLGLFLDSMEVNKIRLDQDKNTMPDSSRDLNFDFLKAIGILSIILAHTLPKSETLIYQLRNFDVPLMVIVSGALFWETSGDKNYSLPDYLMKRCYRLILPTWIFLVFFFIAAYFISQLQGLGYPFSLKEIFYSFTLLIGGIGYVWIIRVFLLMAIIAPLLLSLKRLLGKNTLFLLAIIATYLAYEVLLIFIFQIPEIEIRNLQDFLFQRVLISLLVSQILLLLIPYGCLFAFGMIIPQMKKENIAFFMMIFLAIFVSLALTYASETGSFVLTQNYKYPPRLYYVSYSIFMSLLLYLISERIFREPQKNDLLHKLNLNKIIVFLSSSSLWIYLWHVFLLYYWRILFRQFGIRQDFLPPFFIVATLSILIVLCQKFIVSSIIYKINLTKKTSNFLTIAFLK